MPTKVDAKSYRTQLREWIDNEIATSDQIKLPDLVNSAVNHFESDNRFVREFMRENLRDVIYEEAQRFVSLTRSHVQLGDMVTSRGQFKTLARHKSPFQTWLEHVGDHHVLVLDMTKSDLILAAQERQKRGEHEIAIASLWRAMAERLSAAQRVREVFTPDEIEAMFHQLNS